MNAELMMTVDGAATTAWQLGSAVGTQTLAAEAPWHGVGTDDHLSATTTSVQVFGEANPFVQVATGAYHTCAITSGGVTYCWGSNNAGQLGTGGTENEHAPVPVGSDASFASLALGQEHG